MFRKAYWVCKNCGQEDVTDLNMDGNNEYEHNCSHCNEWSNSFKNFSSNLSYALEKYEAIKSEDLTTAKDTLITDWIYTIKNPPVYIEPTKEELESQKTELLERIAELDIKIEDEAWLTDIG